MTSSELRCSVMAHGAHEPLLIYQSVRFISSLKCAWLALHNTATGGTSSNALRCHLTKALLSLKPQSFRLAQESALEQKPEKRALAPGQVLCRAGERKSDPWHLDSGILYVTEPRRGALLRSSNSPFRVPCSALASSKTMPTILPRSSQAT